MPVPVIFSPGSLWPFGLDRVYGWVAEAGYDGMETTFRKRKKHTGVVVSCPAGRRRNRGALRAGGSL